MTSPYSNKRAHDFTKNVVYAAFIVMAGGCTTTQRSENVSISVYQENDERMTCSELNKEIGRLSERISRLLEHNEKSEKNENDDLPGYAAIPLIGPLIMIPVWITKKLEKSSEEDYGTEAGRLANTYQDRVLHLDNISTSQGC